MGNITKKDDFCQTLLSLRAEKKISIHELTNKVCSESLLRKLEAGDRQATLMVKARIMKRLGEDSDKFDRYLNVNEYGRWIIRQKIITALLEKDISKTDSYINEYYRTYKKPSDIVEAQFLALVKAERAALESTDQAELQRMFEEVRDMSLTVDENGVPNSKLVSSVELHLVMDCAAFYDVEKKNKIWEYIFDICKDESRSNVELSLFAPRALYLRCTNTINSEVVTSDIAKGIVEVIELSIKKLVSAGRLYYLKELLDVLIHFCKVINEPEYDVKIQNASEYLQLLCWIEKLTGTELTPRITSFFFSDRTVFPLGQVIQRRRRMMGISVGQACENICDPKTLRRVEALKTNIQQDIASELLDRLHLCKDLEHHTMSTRGQRHAMLDNYVVQAYRNKDFESAMKYLDESMEFYDMELTESKQFFRRHRAIINYAWGKITVREYADELLQSLYYSLPSQVMPLRDIFLNREEQSTLFNYLTVRDNPYVESAFILEKNRLEHDRREVGLSFDARAYDVTLLGLIISAERRGDYVSMAQLSVTLLKTAMENQRCQQIVGGLANLKTSLENLPEDSRIASLDEVNNMLRIALEHFGLH